MERDMMDRPLSLTEEVTRKPVFVWLVVGINRVMMDRALNLI